MPLVFIGVLSLLFPSRTWAQSSSLTGTIYDASGAGVSNALVIATDSRQALSRETTTNTAGEYLLAGLPAGTYDISVTAPGFERYQVKGLVLRVAEKARADASLALGRVDTQVTVAGSEVAPVELDSSELSGTVTSKQIHQLVLNGRNFTQLVTLVPGVSNQTGQDEGAVGVSGSVAFSVNGGRTEYNNWQLDGGDNMDNGSNSTLNTYPNVDAIAEVRVLTSNYGAQYGRNASGTVETVTKSGTRDFHGDLFEFVRNDAFNARNFFQDTRPEYRKNDFGYTIGGPVFIPKVYNTARQKTFFFFSEEWRKDRVPGQTFNQQVPSSEERSGNFSDVCPAAGGALDTVGFPNCPVNPATGAYYPNNQVSVSSQAQTLLRLIPAPTNGSGASSFFEAAPVQPTNWREELVRVDENLNDKVRLFARFLHDSWNTVSPTPQWASPAGSFPTVQTMFAGPGLSTVANLTATISPTLLNEFVFSYTTDHITLNAIGDVGRPNNFNLPGIFNNGFRNLLPTVNITGAPYGSFAASTGYFPWTNSNPTFTYKDQLTKIVGSHNLYFGAYFAAAQKNEMSSNNQDAQGTLNFQNSWAGSTGNAFADFLTGQIYSFSQTNQLLKYYNRYKIVEPYLQDDWHVTSRLTLNLGFRLSLFGTYRERYRQAYNWDPSAYQPSQAPQVDATGDLTGQAGALVNGSGNPFNGLVQCGSAGVPSGCMRGHLFNPAPRFGFAYDPFGDAKTSIRGGYGIFFEHTNGNEANTESLEGSPPLSTREFQYNVSGYANVGGSGLSFPLAIYAIPTQAIWPYVQQWNFSVQRELPSHSVLTLAYVGSKGTHLTDQRNINQLRPLPASQNPYGAGQTISAEDCSNISVNGQPLSGAAAVNLQVACGANPDTYRPHSGYGSITLLENQADSNYNAMQLALKRYVGHLNFSLAYTYSHSIDDSSDRSDSSFVDAYNLRGNRASSNFDQRHQLNVSYVYDLPVFTGRGLAHTLLGNWQVSGLTTYQTGTPFSVVNGLVNDNAGVGNSSLVGTGGGLGSYADIIGDPRSKPAQQEIAGIPGPLLYNPAAFGAPTGLTFGNGARNILNSPSRLNFDMGLFKRFAIRESAGVEFRAEAFNVFNHTQWLPMNANGFTSSNVTASCYGGANNSAGDAGCLSSSFLHPTGAHNPRILQLGLKFLF